MATDLIGECVTFVGEKYPECDWRNFAVRHVKLGAVLGNQNSSNEEIGEAIEKCLSVIDKLKSSIQTHDPSIQAVEMGMIANVYDISASIKLSQDDCTEQDAKIGLESRNEQSHVQ
jgi:hypothetical protein